MGGIGLILVGDMIVVENEYKDCVTITATLKGWLELKALVDECVKQYSKESKIIEEEKHTARHFWTRTLDSNEIFTRDTRAYIPRQWCEWCSALEHLKRNKRNSDEEIPPIAYRHIRRASYNMQRASTGQGLWQSSAELMYE